MWHKLHSFGFKPSQRCMFVGILGSLCHHSLRTSIDETLLDVTRLKIRKLCAAICNHSCFILKGLKEEVIWNIHSKPLFKKNHLWQGIWLNSLLRLLLWHFFVMGAGSQTHFWAGMTLSWIRSLSIISHNYPPCCLLCGHSLAQVVASPWALGSSMRGLPRGRR